MNDIQQRVDNMHNGSVDEIMNGIRSGCLFESFNAVIAGTRIRLLDKEFVDYVKVATKAENTLMGIPLSDLATASLEILGIQKYSGNDQRIKELIQCEFKF